MEYASAEINPVDGSIMFAYEPVYNLLVKYEYVAVVVAVPAREPADITLPDALTRAAFDVDVRARIARLFVVVRFVPLLRETTLRAAPAGRVGVIERFATVRVAPVPRDMAVFVPLTPVRATVERATFARLFAVERGL